MEDQRDVWPLQEAKARLSELVKKVGEDGPQVISVHGKPKVRLVPFEQPGSSAPTARQMLEAFQSCPLPDFDIPRIRSHGKHRGPQF